MRKPRILFICNTTGSRLWRVNPQARYLKETKGWNVKIMESIGYNAEGIEWADIVVLQMVYDKRVFRKAKKEGVKVVFECDDLIEWVPKDHYAHKDMSLERTIQVYWALRQADAVTVTNHELKRYYDRVRIGKRKCDVLPNYVDLSTWSKPHNPNTSRYLRVGYAGGLSHVKDLELILPMLEKVLSEDNRKFINVSAGGDTFDDPIKQALYPVDMFKGLPQGKKDFVEGVDMYAWPQLLNSLRLDIGLAPLLDNKFTRCKTPIKYMEYAINRVPAVHSRFMYGTIVVDGETGFLADSPEEWIEKTERLIKDKTLREKMGEAAYQDVLANHNADKHLHKWLSVYEALL